MDDVITPEERAQRQRDKAAAERYARLRQFSYRDDGGGGSGSTGNDGWMGS
jgi:hypothetical protein